MDNYEKNYLSKRPQSLCKMCGKCCRMATTSLSFQEISDLYALGDEGAVDFLNVFEPYPSIDAAREADASTVDNIIYRLQENENYDIENLTFYHCKYIQNDNLCGKYSDRPVLCHRFPSSAWAVVPPECGFEGWLFWQREEDKQKVRHSKEQLIELQLLKNKTTDPEVLQKIENVEQKIHRTIDIFKKYGSELW